MSVSILAKADKGMIKKKPFPHLVIKDAIDEALYDQLASEFPSNAEIFSKDVQPDKSLRNNARYQTSAATALESPLWNDFVKYHVSHEFYKEVTNLFGSYIGDIHNIQQRFNKDVEELDVCMRENAGRFVASQSGSADVALDCQVGINSPVTQVSTVRGMHTDAPNKLFVGLFYMRTKDDDSTGGDLNLYRYKDRHPRNMNPENLEIFDTVQYDKNTLVFFVNSPYSVHGVTNRSITPHCRRLINFVGEIYK